MSGYVDMDIFKQPDFDKEIEQESTDSNNQSTVLHGLSFDNGFRCEKVYRVVYDFYSDSRMNKNIGSFEASLNDGSFLDKSNPELLVSRNEFHSFLKEPSEEHCDYKSETNKLDFSLSGIKGIFDCQKCSFEEVSANGRTLSEDELKKLSPDAFFNMVPKGSLFGGDLESEINIASLKEIRIRDEVIADLKDRRFQEVLAEFSSLASDMTDKVKKYSKEVANNNELKNPTARKTLWEDMKDSLYNRFFRDKDLSKINPFVRFVGSNLKRDKDNYNEKLKKSSDKVFKKGQEIEKCHKELIEKYNKLNELAHGLYDDLPFDKREKYLSELRKFSVGIKCINELEAYRKNSSSLIDNKNMFKKYVDNISNDCNLLADIVNKSRDTFKDVYKTSCRESYGLCVESLERTERIKKSNGRIDIMLQPEDAYKAIVKNLMEERPEAFDKGYFRENAEVIFKMKNLSYSKEQIAEALEKASPCFVGKDNDTCLKYVNSVIEKHKKDFDKTNQIRNYNQDKSLGEESKKPKSFKNNKNISKSKLKESNER